MPVLAAATVFEENNKENATKAVSLESGLSQKIGQVFTGKENNNNMSAPQPLKKALGNVQIPHHTKPLEFDEMGLIKIRPRSKDISEIKPKTDNEFCQPFHRHHHLLSGKNDPVGTGVKNGSSTSLMEPSSISISERRTQKLMNKASMPTSISSYNNVQLPIKDTSEDDLSILSETQGLDLRVS